MGWQDFGAEHLQRLTMQKIVKDEMCRFAMRGSARITAQMPHKPGGDVTESTPSHLDTFSLAPSRPLEEGPNSPLPTRKRMGRGGSDWKPAQGSSWGNRGSGSGYLCGVHTARLSESQLTLTMDLLLLEQVQNHARIDVESSHRHRTQAKAL